MNKELLTTQQMARTDEQKEEGTMNNKYYEGALRALKRNDSKINYTESQIEFYADLLKRYCRQIKTATTQERGAVKVETDEFDITYRAEVMREAILMSFEVESYNFSFCLYNQFAYVDLVGKENSFTISAPRAINGDNNWKYYYAITFSIYNYRALDECSEGQEE